MSKAKPVASIDAGKMSLKDFWEWLSKYEYNAHTAIDGVSIWLASDSLNNLKKEVVRRGWYRAVIQAEHGSFSSGQNVVSQYFYCPKWLRRPRYPDYTVKEVL